MSNHIVAVRSADMITHDAVQIVVERPSAYKFRPGQATDVAINKEGWKEATRPFSFTNLPDDEFLAFVIKMYPDRNGVTKEMGNVRPGDQLIIDDAWGAISYKGEGVFLAGGAGVTPFIAIVRDLQSKGEVGLNKLLFANKSRADIILENEFRSTLGENFVNILSDETIDGYAHGFITEEFLRSNVSDVNTNFYVCGPPPMMDAVQKILTNLGVVENSVIVEL